MFHRLKTWFQPSQAPAETAPASAPVEIVAPGAPPFDVVAALIDADGLPVMDWQRVGAWVQTLAEADQPKAWSDCEQAWVAHLRDALGPAYQVRAEGDALLLSSLSRPVAQATLAFVNRTQQRILRTLDGVAQASGWGHDILIVFGDEDLYYRYVAHYYPEAGEFAASSGMYIHHGCGHFVTVSADLHVVEPVIAHELTHACLGHLPIPAWLNEGLAVNTERRLTPRPGLAQDPRLMHQRHLAFWGESEIQQFWSGKSFLRNDEANELSYDLARLLVEQFAADWAPFAAFACAAELDDAGAAAARAHLALDLGGAVCAMLGREPDPAWSPRPQTWADSPERGAFHSHQGETRAQGAAL